MQQDSLLAASLGVTHIERNGHHYVDGFGSRAARPKPTPSAPPIPGLYDRDRRGRVHLRVHDGRLDLRSLHGAGFARAAEPRWEHADPHRPEGLHDDHPQRLGIIMHGVTGRMGMNQHLIRSIVAIRDQGGVTLSNGDTVMPDPILIGRNAEKIEALAQGARHRALGHRPRRGTRQPGRHGVLRRRHDADAPDPAGPGDPRRQTCVLRKADRHQPERGGRDRQLAQASGLKHGAVQDKLFLPGLRKLDMLRRAGFFGRMLACASSSATGSSKAICSRSSARAGTTAAKTAAA